MNVRSIQHLAARVTGALLVLAMLAGPALAQAQASERCRTACEPASKSAHASCCATADGSLASERQPADGQDRPDPSRKHSGSCPKYCPGCNGRPLVVDTSRLTLTLDPAPMLVPMSGALTSASFDVPFAIFHPPRA